MQAAKGKKLSAGRFSSKKLPKQECTSISLQGRADHGHHGGLAVAPNAVLQDPCQLAIPATLHHVRDQLSDNLCWGQQHLT